MVGSHIMNQNICGITDRDIEEGYHVKRVRPHEGIRLCYTPSDEKDFEFCELNTRVVVDPDKRAANLKDNWSTSLTPYQGTRSTRLYPHDLMYFHGTNRGLMDEENVEENTLQV